MEPLPLIRDPTALWAMGSSLTIKLRYMMLQSLMREQLPGLVEGYDY